MKALLSALVALLLAGCVSAGDAIIFQTAQQRADRGWQTPVLGTGGTILLMTPHGADTILRAPNQEPMQIYAEKDGASIRLPDNRATWMERQGEQILLK